MKKRVLSIVCVVALIATMISAGAIYAIGTDTAPLTDEAFSLTGTGFVATDWTTANTTPSYADTGLKMSSGSLTGYASAEYKDKYDLTNGFTLEYSAKARVNINTSNAGEHYTGVKIGNVTVAMDQFIKPVILVDGTVKTTGASISTATTGADIRNWVNGTEPAIDEIKYTVTYDVTANTLTYARTHGTTEAFSIVYTDAANLIDVDSAEIALYSCNLKNSNVTYKSIKLTGAAAPTPPAPPSTLYGTGFEFGSSKPVVVADWTFSHDKAVTTEGGLNLKSSNMNSYISATYNDTFILDQGFTATYSAYNSTTNKNYAVGNMYLGTEVGNISAGIEIADDNKNSLVLVIKVDGTKVATSGVIYDENHAAWDASARDNKGNLEYFFSKWYLGTASPVFTLSYDPATKVITYSLDENGNVTTLTYTSDAVDVSDATVVLKSHSTWSIFPTYNSYKLVGATCPGHEYDDDNDTTCNKCGEVRTIGGGNEPGGNEPGGNEPGGNEPSEPAPDKGEALTTKWAPEKFVAADWSDTTDITDGRFVIPSGQVTKTIWTTKNYDLSTGFTFSGDLVFKNSYNNYYGEYCSAYFGTQAKNLELRIKNDSKNNTEKDKTYTAYLYVNGKEIASYDLEETPNGTYEVTYKEGKVSVSLDGVKLNWTLKDTTTAATDVDVTVDLLKAKLGLRLSNNWAPNGREWKGISLAPLSTGDQGGQGGSGGQGGEAGGDETTPSKPVLVGTGVSFNSKKEENYPKADDWTPNGNTKIKLTKKDTVKGADGKALLDENGETTIIEVPTGKFILSGGDSDATLEATYKDKFNVTEGFTLTYNVLGSGTKNYAVGKPYLGASVGNITAGVEVIDYKDGKQNGVALALYVGGKKVAESKPFFTDRGVNWDWNQDDPRSNLYNFFASPYSSFGDVNTKPVYVLKYDPATKTVTFTKTLNDDTVAGEITYVDVDNKLKLDEAELTLVSRRSYNVDATYTSLEFEGKPDPNKVVEIEKGETLTSWAPESFLEEDWEESEGIFTDGAFVIPSGQTTRTVWTTKNYDMSAGFKFKGTLSFKNGYNNFYGEWCSAYFGTKDKNIELRIKNDSLNNNEKDNTYTAYIIYKGKEVASYDLLTLPNGEYELTYAGGKLSVSLGGTAIKWKLADGTEATAVPVEGADAILVNAKLGLRLSNNYCPNGRKWAEISLVSLNGGTIVTGDSRNLVLPACLMLVCAVSAAFVLIKKKSRA